MKNILKFMFFSKIAISFILKSQSLCHFKKLYKKLEMSFLAKDFIANLTTEINFTDFEYLLFKKLMENQKIFEKEITHKSAIIIFVLPLIILIGIIGNLLNIIIFSRRVFKYCSTFRFLIHLSVFDLLVLLICASDAFLRFGFQIHIRQYSTFICKLHTFFTYLFTHASSATLTIISIQRALVMANKSIYLSVFRLKRGQMIHKEPHSYYLGSNICCIFQLRLKSTIKKHKIYSLNWRRVDLLMAAIITFLTILNIHFMFFMKLDFKQSAKKSRNTHGFCFPQQGNHLKFFKIIYSFKSFKI